MEYGRFTVAFIKAETQDEYRFQVYASSANQALSIARSRLAKKLGAGEFKVVED